MECKEVRELFFEYREGALSALKKESVAKHLLACKDCAREYKTMSEALSYIKCVPDEQIPESFYRGLEKKIEQAETPFYARFAAYLTLQNTAMAVSGIFAGLVLGIYISNYVPGAPFSAGTHTLTGKQQLAENKSGTKSMENRTEPNKVIMYSGNISHAGYDLDEIVNRFEGSSTGVLNPETPAKNSINLSKKYVITVPAGKYEELIKELNKMGYLMKLPSKKEMAELKKLKPTDQVKLELEITQ